MNYWLSIFHKVLTHIFLWFRIMIGFGSWPILVSLYTSFNRNQFSKFEFIYRVKNLYLYTWWSKNLVLSNTTIQAHFLSASKAMNGRCLVFLCLVGASYSIPRYRCGIHPHGPTPTPTLFSALPVSPPFLFPLLILLLYG